MREAANLLTNEFKSEHPDTQWKLITGMRNYIVHEYFQVDNTVIYCLGNVFFLRSVLE